MHDAAARRHPLDVAGAELAAVAEAVAVLDRAGQHIGDGLDAAMRVPREAGEKVLRPVVAEIVEQQEGIEVAGLPETEGAVKLDAGAFKRGLGIDHALDGTKGHGAVSTGLMVTNGNHRWVSWRKRQDPGSASGAGLVCGRR